MAGRLVLFYFFFNFGKSFKIFSFSLIYNSLYGFLLMSSFIAFSAFSGFFSLALEFFVVVVVALTRVAFFICVVCYKAYGFSLQPFDGE